MFVIAIDGFLFASLLFQSFVSQNTQISTIPVGSLYKKRSRVQKSENEGLKDQNEMRYLYFGISNTSELHELLSPDIPKLYGYLFIHVALLKDGQFRK